MNFRLSRGSTANERYGMWLPFGRSERTVTGFSCEEEETQFRRKQRR
jgi:hypothetical protein